MKKKQAAFTLVEAIVSVAVFSIVLAMVYGVFFSLARSTVAGAEATVEIQRQRIALKTIEDSLSAGLYEQSPTVFLSGGFCVLITPALALCAGSPISWVTRIWFPAVAAGEFTVEDDGFGPFARDVPEALMQPVNTQDIREPDAGFWGRI